MYVEYYDHPSLIKSMSAHNCIVYPRLKMLGYIDEISLIGNGRVIDYRLIEISAFYRDFIAIIDNISDFLDIFTYFSAILPIILSLIKIF